MHEDFILKRKYCNSVVNGSPGCSSVCPQLRPVGPGAHQAQITSDLQRFSFCPSNRNSDFLYYNLYLFYNLNLCPRGIQAAQDILE